MTRSAVRGRAAVTLVIAACAPLAIAAAPPRPAVCPLEIVGTWRLASSTEAQPTLLTFQPDGWVNVVGASGEGRPEDLDILAQVRYQPVPRREPRRIEFQARRGNDVFPPGVSSWDITSHTDESFASRRSDSVAGEQALWSRLQTRRYFLTFAARDAGPGRATAAFVMWMTLDGKKVSVEALGTTTEGAQPRFGRVPDALTKAFMTESKRAEDAMLRIELSEAEYLRAHQVFEAWNTLLSRDVLAKEDPASQALGLIDATVQSVNRCGAKLRHGAAETAAADASQGATAPGRAAGLVRALRKLNDRRHVPDKAFPSRWQPPSVAS